MLNSDFYEKLGKCQHCLKLWSVNDDKLHFFKNLPQSLHKKDVTLGTCM